MQVSGCKMRSKGKRKSKCGSQLCTVGARTEQPDGNLQPCSRHRFYPGAPFGRLPCGLRVGAPACDRAVALAGAVTWERRHPACAGLRYPSLSARSFQLRALRLVGPTRLKRPVGQFGVAGCFPVSTWWCIAGGRSSGRVRSHSQADLKQECTQRLMGSRIETARSSPR